jgi:hypothetical protein
MGAMDPTAQISVYQDSVRMANIGGAPASRPAVSVRQELAPATGTAVMASTCPEIARETFSLDFVPQAITGDASVTPFVVRPTIPAIRMDVMGSMLRMEKVREFVLLETLMDVCVARFAQRGTRGHALTVKGRTGFAPPGILLAATAVILLGLTVLLGITILLVVLRLQV